jgi:hypothetical protein
MHVQLHGPLLFALPWHWYGSIGSASAAILKGDGEREVDSPQRPPDMTGEYIDWSGRCCRAKWTLSVAKDGRGHQSTGTVTVEVVACKVWKFTYCRKHNLSIVTCLRILEKAVSCVRL